MFRRFHAVARFGYHKRREVALPLLLRAGDPFGHVNRCVKRCDTFRCGRGGL